MDAASQRVATPALAMKVLGIVFAIMAVFGMVMACGSPVINILSTAMQAGTAVNEDEMIAAMIGGLFGSTFAIVLSIINIVLGIIGLGSGIFGFTAASKLETFQSKGSVQIAAILTALQPLVWLLTSCFTSSCGMCGWLIWLPFTIAGVVTAVLVMSALSDPDVAAQFEANGG